MNSFKGKNKNLKKDLKPNWQPMQISENMSNTAKNAKLAEKPNERQHSVYVAVQLSDNGR